ncbi:alpha/beta fold hydrolase [Roseibium aggregatum]|uniref:Alpha/beta hydrolase n=1 Tax=Roseibium aggregatum TaxID=187304 RepID=A0A926S6M6_9HYPH|nr:alpha/beta hydrolase [Roseibium aggregatum]MBD1546652.1 alpha/beta hydrolase [Roseibium aggregatum]
MTTLVLVPGLLSDDIVWQPLADAVADRMPVYQADLNGGNSISGMARDLLDKVPGDLIVVGHSMGGRVAMEMAHLAPERIKGLVLANTGHGPKREGEDVKRQAMIDLGNESMEKLADQWLPPMVDERRVGDADLMNKLRAMVLRANAEIHEGHIRALVGRPNATAYLTDIDCPILLLVGRQDRWSPIAQHEEIKAATKNSELAVIEDAGHFAPVERPEDVVKAVTDWLGRTFGDECNG